MKCKGGLKIDIPDHHCRQPPRNYILEAAKRIRGIPSVWFFANQRIGQVMRRRLEKRCGDNVCFADKASQDQDQTRMPQLALFAFPRLLIQASSRKIHSILLHVSHRTTRTTTRHFCLFSCIQIIHRFPNIFESR